MESLLAKMLGTVNRRPNADDFRSEVRVIQKREAKSKSIQSTKVLNVTKSLLQMLFCLYWDGNHVLEFIESNQVQVQPSWTRGLCQTTDQKQARFAT